MQKAISHGLLVAMIITLFVVVEKVSAQGIDLALARAHATTWMQCQALSDDGTLADSGLQVTREGRILRPKTDYRRNFHIGSKIRGFWHALGKTFAQREIHFALIPIPPRGLRKGFKPWQPSDYNPPSGRISWKRAIRHWQYLGINAIDLLPAFDPLGTRTAMLRDHHWSPEGARVAALILADKLSQEPILQGLPKEEYLLTGEKIPYTGTYSKQFNRHCKANVPPEFLTQWDAVWQSDDLFGEAPQSTISVSGASNLNAEFSFIAHLQHALSLPVNNASVSGGGFHHGILSVLETPPEQPLPFWLVWVAPGYLGELYTLKDVHREILAAAQGRCTTRNAIEQKHASVTSDRQVFHFSRPADDGALYIQIAQPLDENGAPLWVLNKRLRVEIETDNGDTWLHTFTRFRSGLRLFTLPLPDKKEWHEAQITLFAADDIPAEAFMCASSHLPQWPFTLTSEASDQTIGKEKSLR